MKEDMTVDNEYVGSTWLDRITSLVWWH